MDGSALVAALPRPQRLPDRDQANRGDGQTVGLSRLPASDRERVQRLYAELVALQELTDAHAGNPERSFEVLSGIEEARVAALFADAHQLGADLPRDDLECRKAIHDVRGGSLAAVLTHLDLIHERIAGPVDAERVHLLLRDHLKMMRNALFDLDPERYSADLLDRHHGMELLREKWTKTQYPVGGQSITVQLESAFHGVVSERCMEFSSLDRVLYNLVNNAGRFAADQRVLVRADAVDDAADTNLRFAVINRVTEAQVDALTERFGDALGQVYEGGFTTGGHGLGLRICADLVRHAYSMISVNKTIAQHIIGARVVDGHYVAWFHWPARRAAT